MARLSVNVDHVATIRETRRIKEPDPVTAAAFAELAGADGIIVHLREDRRHIKDRDLRLLRETVKTKLILEMAVTEEMIRIALDVKPEMVTLVPEKREELTTEGGLDINMNKENVKDSILKLQEKGILVSLFVDPDIDQIKAAHKVSSDYVEIHTGRFCEAYDRAEQERELERILISLKMASKLKLGINAGHGLNYQNIKTLIGIEEIEEFSIGHSIVSRALLVGMNRAVREMIALINLPSLRNP
ncbi:MAG: pyridoxine 5'-phosphate synthase [Thermodesulfobacteriota bacterium]|nr:pyridoxine 5'-phosphate synthase [Thermodesulfobacteriota bacterium]